MTQPKSAAGQAFSSDEADARLTEVAKGQQLAVHYPDLDSMDRARRLLTDEITPAEAYAEIDKKTYDPAEVTSTELRCGAP